MNTSDKIIYCKSLRVMTPGSKQKGYLTSTYQHKYFDFVQEEQKPINKCTCVVTMSKNCYFMKVSTSFEQIKQPLLVTNYHY